MSTRSRLVAFAAGVAVVFAAALGVGAAFGPAPAKADTEPPMPMGQGVVAAQDGYRLIPTSPLAGDGGTFQFRIADPDGRPATRFTPIHERLLHLIVVNQEMSVYHHVHPTLAADGTWSVELPTLPAGSYRAIADFQTKGGPHLALGADLAVAGTYTPQPIDQPTWSASVDGYRVDMTAQGHKGGEVTVAMAISHDGRPVADLEPYLGANGHLVALRAGDLAYVHVHPLDETTPAGTVVFDAVFDAAGRYGLFLDFKHHGVVHTAHFTFDQGVVHGAVQMKD